MARFKRGDNARVKYIRNVPFWAHKGLWKPGIVVEVISVQLGSMDEVNDVYDYIVTFGGGGYRAYVLEEQLEPIVKDGVSSWDDVEEICGWNPAKVNFNV